MFFRLTGTLASVSICLNVGCASVGPPRGASQGAAKLRAIRTDSPVRIDGRLDESVWQHARAYALVAPAEGADHANAVVEPGRIRLAWDDKFLYLAAELTDSDVVAEGERNQLSHWQMGDVIELFLRPDDHTWYWEFYVTPSGLKTSYWFPGGGRLGLPSCLDYDCGLVVGASVDGTINDWRDVDTTWCAEMAVPVADLTSRGERFGAESAWHILIGRYNYSRYLPRFELSAVPPLPKRDFHALASYAELVLEE